jgi:hypothetical protein
VVKIKKSLYSSFRELSLVVVVVKIQVEVFWAVTPEDLDLNIKKTKLK